MLFKLITLVCFSLSVTALAEQADEIIRTEFLTLSLGKSCGPYYYKNDGEIAELSASSRGIGAPTPYQGSRLLALYRNRDDLEKRPAGKPIPQPVAQVRLPLDEDRILLICSKKGSAADEAPILHATGISTARMKTGDYRLFNMSKCQVLIMMNQQKAIIEPGSIADISDGSWESNVIDMQVQIGVRDDQQARRVYSSVWGHRPGRRTFLFIFDRPNKFKPIEIRNFYDVPTPKDSTQ